MSGGKKKKSSSSGNKSGKKTVNNKETVPEVKDNFIEEAKNVEGITENSDKASATKSSKSPNGSSDAFAANPSVDVLDRLAPPILFFPPNVAEEYLNRFCPAPQSVTPSENSLLADEGFPDREIPVMRRLLAMMAGIMSKASAASARTYYSRVAGTEGRRNGYFQQNLNTSVFNLFSTLSAAGNPQASTENEKDLHLTPAAAFTAKDGEPLRGYPSRLMKFWRQLSPTEQLRLVKEEHAALTNSWIESRQNWCLCAHCKHRRMTISDLTDCLYQTYCEELEAFLISGGQGSTLYSPNLTNSMEPAAKARRFLFKSLSVVGEQALLPRYNQFILRLEAFSSMAFSMKDVANEKRKGHKVKIPCDLKNGIKNGLKSAALQASKEFLQFHGKNATEIEEFMAEKFLPPSENLKKLSKALENPLEGLGIRLVHGSDDEDCVVLGQSDSEISDSENSELEDDEDDRESHQGGIQSEDDDDLIDEETDLPIDESELMLPGGASFPLLPIGDGPVQWSESSRIECGRTVFLMFASEMFQYRLTAAYLAHQTKLRQMKLLAEVEEEERQEKEKRAREEREKKEKKEAEKKKKAAKKEKAAAKANGALKTKKQVEVKKPVKNVAENEQESEDQKENIIENNSLAEKVTFTVTEPEPVVVTVSSIEPVAEPLTTEPLTVIKPDPQTFVETQTDNMMTDQLLGTPVNTNNNNPLLSSPLFPANYKPEESNDDDDDFDPTLLVEQLSKEMNRFELFAGEKTKTMSPPGFAPPPGFAAAEPKHLEEAVGMGGYGYSARPPFSLDYEDYYGYTGYPQVHPVIHLQPQQHGFMPPGYQQPPFDPYQGAYHQGYPANYHPMQTMQGYHNAPPFNPGYHHRPVPPQQPQYNNHYNNNYNNNYHSHSHPHSHPHAHHHQQRQDEINESRFQSFFSKSIFGPSTFFSQ